jgi:hypothetical protein
LEDDEGPPADLANALGAGRINRPLVELAEMLVEEGLEDRLGAVDGRDSHVVAPIA